nr:MAG TPA: TRL10 protein [Bacteriophage sp.]
MFKLKPCLFYSKTRKELLQFVAKKQSIKK